MSPLTSAVSTALLLITPFNDGLFEPSSCLPNTFYGNYRSGWHTTHSVFLPDAACLNSLTTSDFATEVHISQITRFTPDQRLVWVEKEAVEASLIHAEKEKMDDFFKHFGRVPMTAPGIDQQQTLSQLSYRSYELLYQTPDVLLLSVPSNEAYGIDLILPRFWKSTILPTFPVEHVPVSPESIEPIRKILAKLRFDPVVASIVNNISVPQMKRDIRFLTGEDEKSGIVSRHSFTPGAIVAANWIKEVIEESGAKCELWSFMEGFTPNVIW